MRVSALQACRHDNPWHELLEAARASQATPPLDQAGPETEERDDDGLRIVQCARPERRQQ
jgi:hypothetical protein